MACPECVGVPSFVLLHMEGIGRQLLVHIVLWMMPDQLHIVIWLAQVSVCVCVCAVSLCSVLLSHTATLLV